MPRSRRSRTSSSPLVFETRNYVLLAVGVALVAIGFAIMRLENEFLGTISLYVAPLLILTGYAEVIYAILWRSEETKSRLAKAQQDMAAEASRDSASTGGDRGEARADATEKREPAELENG